LKIGTKVERGALGIQLITAGAKVLGRKDAGGRGEQVRSEVDGRGRGETQLACLRLIGECGPWASLETRDVLRVTGRDDCGVSRRIYFLWKMENDGKVFTVQLWLRTIRMSMPRYRARFNKLCMIGG
jgi:hypothetical protein